MTLNLPRHRRSRATRHSAAQQGRLTPIVGSTDRSRSRLSTTVDALAAGPPRPLRLSVQDALALNAELDALATQEAT